MVRHFSRQGRRDEQGFTLIEIMIVVVILAILAAVVIPVFFGQAKKVKAKTEVSAMIAELVAKQERYKVESNTYLDVAECPTPPSNVAKAVTTCQGVGSDWNALGVNPPESTLRCSYEVISGLSSDNPTGSIPVGSGFVVPAGCCATGWYIIHARCDMDANGVFSHYTTASFDANLQIANEGE